RGAEVGNQGGEICRSFVEVVLFRSRLAFDPAARFERRRARPGRRLPGFTRFPAFGSGIATRPILGKAPAIDHLEVGNVVLVLRHTSPSEAVSRPHRVASDAQAQILSVAHKSMRLSHALAPSGIAQ